MGHHRVLLLSKHRLQLGVLVGDLLRGRSHGGIRRGEVHRLLRLLALLRHAIANVRRHLYLLRSLRQLRSLRSHRLGERSSSLEIRVERLDLVALRPRRLSRHRFLIHHPIEPRFVERARLPLRQLLKRVVRSLRRRMIDIIRALHTRADHIQLRTQIVDSRSHLDHALVGTTLNLRESGREALLRIHHRLLRSSLVVLRLLQLRRRARQRDALVAPLRGIAGVSNHVFDRRRLGEGAPRVFLRVKERVTLRVLRANPRAPRIVDPLR